MRLKNFLLALVFLLMQLVVSTQALRSADELPFWARIVIAVSTGVLVAFMAAFAWVLNRPEKKVEPYLPEATVNYVDPLNAWVQDNQAIIQQYPNCHLAVSPTIGIIAHGRTDVEFTEALESLDGNVPEDMVICHYDQLVERPINTVLH